MTVIQPKRKFSLDLDELIQFRELLFFLTWRDIKVKYKQAVLGFIWAILQPIVMMAIFTVFFGKVLNIPSNNLPYPLFVFSGLLLWNLFSAGTTTSANSMVQNSNIIKKIYFPRIIIPISAILGTFFDFLMALVVYIFLIIYYSYSINIFEFAGCLTLALLITLFTTSGVGFILSALNVSFRDFRYIVPFLVQVLLFVTPVIYPLSILPEGLTFLLNLNPLSGAIQLLRSFMVGSPISWNLVLISFSISVLIFIIGFLFFKHSESKFADIV